MNKATSVQSFTYLGLVVSENNVPKHFTNLTLWGYGLQSPLKDTTVAYNFSTKKNIWYLLFAFGSHLL